MCVCVCVCVCVLETFKLPDEYVNSLSVSVSRDALLVSFGNCLTSVFAGFVIFSYLGFLAKELGQNVGDVADGGRSLNHSVVRVLGGGGRAE